MKRIILFLIASVLLNISVFSQIKFKDGESIPNILLQLNDEGIAGSLLLPPLVSIPGDTDQKLYNILGDLYWNGNKIGNSFSAAGWTYNGAHILTSTVNDKVGIGMSTAPNVKLSLGTDFTAKKLAIWDGAGDFYGFGSPFGRMAIFASDVERMSILSNGNIGIGTTLPDAALEVKGYVKIGTDGVKFSDIIEITGQTGSSGDRITISYPIGYNKMNTRVLSYEVREIIANGWISGDDGLWSALGDYDITLAYGPLYSSSYFRLVLMRVEQILTK